MIPAHAAENLTYTDGIMSAVLTTSPQFNSTESKALELLASGIEQVAVAGALAISESRLSQIIAQPEFAAALADARYKQLAKHNETDNLYDKIERKLAEKLEQTAALMFKPTEIARTLSLVNGLKRRGASNPDAIVRQKNVVKLNIPIAVINRFSTNAAGQVVSVETEDGKSDLVTMQSGNLRGLLNEHAKSLEQQQLPAPRKTEADGVKWVKPQGRESHDILAECGFTVDVDVSTTGSNSSS